MLFLAIIFITSSFDAITTFTNVKPKRAYTLNFSFFVNFRIHQKTKDPFLYDLHLAGKPLIIKELL